MKRNLHWSLRRNHRAFCRTFGESKVPCRYLPRNRRRNMSIRLCFAGLCLFLAAGGVLGQVKPPPETRNAALRYWQAFSELKDPPADQGIQQEMQKVLSGDAPWDEVNLGGVVA